MNRKRGRPRSIVPGAPKVCPRCKEELPRRLKYYRMICVGGVPHKWSSWCRACEAECYALARERRKMEEYANGD